MDIQIILVADFLINIMVSFGIAPHSEATMRAQKMGLKNVLGLGLESRL